MELDRRPTRTARTGPAALGLLASIVAVSMVATPAWSQDSNKTIKKLGPQSDVQRRNPAPEQCGTIIRKGKRAYKLGLFLQKCATETIYNSKGEVLSKRNVCTELEFSKCL